MTAQKHANPFASYVLRRVGLRSLLVLGVLVFGFLVVGRVSARWDLTQDKRFTLSDASIHLVQDLKDPLTIRAYFSNNLPSRFEPLQRQVFDLLDEYRAHGHGKVKVERYDPSESKTIESEASNYGVAPVELSVVEATAAQALQVYGGIVLLYRDRASEVINVASLYPQGYQGLSNLEYQIDSKLDRLAHERRSIGLAGDLMSAPPANRFQPQHQPKNEFQDFRSLLGSRYEIQDVDLKSKQPDPKKIPLLLVIRPKQFTDVEVFHLDQYLMKGGRVILFITQGTISRSRFDPSFRYKPFKTGLAEWLHSQGIRVPNEFVCQFYSARPTQVEIAKGIVSQIPNWFWPVIRGGSHHEKNIDTQNPAVRSLHEVSFFWPHPVEIVESQLAKGEKATALVRSYKEESWIWKDLQHIDRTQIDAQSAIPASTDLQSSPLVVALDGTFRSYFADRPVPPSLTSSGKDSDKKDPKAKGPEVVKTSVPTDLVVVGNAIFLSDDVLGSTQDADTKRKLALLGLDLVDWLGGSKELIGLRAKQYRDRRLKDTIKSDAEEWAKKVQKGDMSQKDFREKVDKALDLRKARRGHWRWANIGLATGLVLVAGFLVWIFRAAWRAKAKPPQMHFPDGKESL